MKSSRVRNPSVDLLRIVLMFLIVLGHSWTMFTPGKGIYQSISWWMFLLMGLIIWHVDGFISISGWFGIRFSWKKLFALLGTIAFYTMCGNVVEILWGGAGFSIGSLKLQGGWFGSAYLALMLLAPLLDAAVSALSAISRRKLFCSWLLIAMALFFTWAPGHLFTSINALGCGHQSLGMMAFVYLTARVAKVLFPKPPPLKWLLLGVAAYVAQVVVVGFISDSVGNTASPYFWQIWGPFLQNHSPCLYLVAIDMLLIFVWYVRMPERVGRVVLAIAPAMFGVYLVHMHFLVRIESWLYARVSWHPFVVMVMSSMVVFVGCIGLDMVRQLLVRSFCGPIVRWIARIDERWSAFEKGNS